MKTSGIIASVLLGALALGLTVWIGKYQGKKEVLIPPILSSAPVDPGPPISKTGPHPKAVAEETEYDFGLMSLHQEGSHKFTIKNDGQAELKLMARREDATCQCTLGELSDGDAIPPGESREITLSWKIKVQVDTFRHSAKIRTNDPENRIIEFVVKGKVDPRFQITPGEILEVGELSRTESTKTSLSVYSSVVESFAINSVTCANNKVKVTYEPLAKEVLTEKEARSGYQVNVEVLPGIPIGPFSEAVVLTTDDSIEHEIHFKLQGHMSGPIEFLGPAYRSETNILNFGEFNAADGKEVTLSLFVRDFDDELQLLEVVPASDRVQFELKKGEKLSGKARRYQLKAKVLPGDPIDGVRGPPMKVQLKFNHPEAEAVQISVRMLGI